ncbi:MAG: hypothetical protein ACPIOQ_17875 [Promethearchaeia archaeon]
MVTVPSGRAAARLLSDDEEWSSMLGAWDQSCSAQRGVPMTALIRASAPSQVQLTAILTRLHVVAGCIHNDISARNVFICTNSGVVRLANFFFSQFPKRVPGA